MSYSGATPQQGFRLEVTPLGRRLMGLYALLWLLLYGFTHWVAPAVGESVTSGAPSGLSESNLWQVLLLHPLGSSASAPWQLLSGPLFFPPVGGFSSLMLAFLGFIFFAAPVERMLGVRSFLQLWLVASMGAALGALLLGALLPGPPAWGFAPAVFAVMVVHCMMTPEASVPFNLIFTILHVRMKWIAAAIAAMVGLRTLGLVGGGPAGVYSLVGMACGYFFWRGGANLNPRTWMRRRRARANLRVVVDQALQPQSDDDGPVYH